MTVLEFSAPTPGLSEHIIESLTTYLTNFRKDDNSPNKYTMVSRDETIEKLAQAEIELNFDAEIVNQDTAQSAGKATGVQIFISGSFRPLGDTYRILVRATEVETRGNPAQETRTVALDRTLAGLLGIDYKVPDFSIGRRIGAGFLNTVAGLGSFTMGDWPNGLILVAGYAVSAGLIVWDIAGFTYDDEMAGVPGAVGFALAGATAVYGFVRPFLYHKPESQIASALGGIRIAVLPGRERIKAVQLSYTFRF
jgi:hypothetical protein